MLQAFRQTGEQEILARLYLRYTDLIYGVCAKYLTQEAAKDAVMSIYEELLLKVPQHNIENFRSWLYVVSKNFCLMQLRKEKKMITVEFSSAVMHSEDFSHLDNMLEKEQDFKKLEQCMKTLPAEQKQSIELFYLQNKCYNEIVEITGSDWNKIRSLIQNGRRNLKICMDKSAE